MNKNKRNLPILSGDRFKNVLMLSDLGGESLLGQEATRLLRIVNTATGVKQFSPGLFSLSKDTEIVEWVEQDIKSRVRLLLTFVHPMITSLDPENPQRDKLFSLLEELSRGFTPDPYNGGYSFPLKGLPYFDGDTVRLLDEEDFQEMVKGYTNSIKVTQNLEKK